MKKKTMGVLLTILLLSIYGMSVNAKDGGNPLDEIWDYINSIINPALEDHEARITALEGPEPIRIGITSCDDPANPEPTVYLAAIAEADINQYVEDLGLDMTFEFVVTDNSHEDQNQLLALINTMSYKVALVVAGSWRSTCCGCPSTAAWKRDRMASGGTGNR